jgi:hypothetical protein
MAFNPPPYDHPSYSIDRRLLLDGQERASSKVKQAQMKQANITRDRKIYAFKREFFLVVATREASGMDVAGANTRAEEAVMILYPPVTEENAEEYLLRA